MNTFISQTNEIMSIKCKDSFNGLFRLFDCGEYNTQKMIWILFALMKEYNNFTEIQKTNLKLIAQKFGFESFNVICIITNNIELLQPNPNCVDVDEYMDVPINVIETCFMYQKPEILNRLITLGWKFSIEDCLHMMDDPYHPIQFKISIIRDFFFNALAPTSREVLNILLSGVFSGKNEDLPINKLHLPIDIFKIIYNYVIFEFIDIKTLWDFHECEFRFEYGSIWNCGYNSNNFFEEIKIIKEWLDKYEFLKPTNQNLLNLCSLHRPQNKHSEKHI